MSEKRTQLIQTALTLFYRNGIHATGINEVLLQAGVAKKTLYSHFATKEELVAAAVNYRDDLFRHWLVERMDASSAGAARVLALFEALDDWFNDRVEELMPFRGCFFINTCAEYGDPNHPLHRQCGEHKAQIQRLLHQTLRPLVNTEEDALALTDSLCLLKEGAITLAHVQGDRLAARKARRAAAQLLTAYGVDTEC